MINPKPKYIVATDYDGTLRQGEVSEDTVDMIRQFRAAGHLFGVVTGRTYENGYAVFRKQNLFPFDFIISHNGAVGYDEEGNILFARSVVWWTEMERQYAGEGAGCSLSHPFRWT